MVKKIIEIFGDRTTSSLILSIIGLVFIMAFAMLKYPVKTSRSNH